MVQVFLRIDNITVKAVLLVAFSKTFLPFLQDSAFKSHTSGHDFANRCEWSNSDVEMLKLTMVLRWQFSRKISEILPKKDIVTNSFAEHVLYIFITKLLDHKSGQVGRLTNNPSPPRVVVFQIERPRLVRPALARSPR